MFFLLMSFILSEQKYNGEMRKFNKAIDRLHQKYIKIREIVKGKEIIEGKEGWKIVNDNDCSEIVNTL